MAVRRVEVDALLIKFWIKTNVEHDPEIFLASVADVFWLEKELKIKSLAERYEDVWDALLDNNYGLEDDIFRTHKSFSKMYFTEIMEPFEEVIYPKGDPDAVSISKRDIELLEPDTFVNDTIIDFYIKHLQDRVKHLEKSRFHFFNCFFFRKLADLDKDPGSISEGRAAYQRVRKWTRKLNIFEKDYIFIPVNYNLHWSLLVICHPGEIITFEDDDDLKSSPKVPCILHMDSFKGSHKGLEKLIQSYLLEEWKGRNSEFPDDITSRFSNLRFVRLELPQQENSSDCGLFLLHYVEMFLEEAPIFFNPTKITKLSNFLSADWFPPSEASFKRFHIRRLIYELLRDSSQKLTPTSSNEDISCFGDDGDDADQAVEFLSAHDSPSKAVTGSTLILPSTTQDDIFEQTTSFKSSPAICAMVEHGNANAETTELLDGEGEADSAEPPVSIGGPTLQIYPTPFYQVPSIMEQVKETVVFTSPTGSCDQLTISNERDETPKLITSPIIVSCTFVPDTPDTSNQQREDYAENSQENNVEVEINVDPDPYGGSDESCPETSSLNDSETRHEEEHEKADMTETNSYGHHKIDDDDSDMAESLDAEAHEMMSGYEEAGVVADSQENDFIKDTSREDHRLCSPDLETTAVTIPDDDAAPPKRNSIPASMQRGSKRRKLDHQDMQPRVTRSSLRKLGS